MTDGRTKTFDTDIPFSPSFPPGKEGDSTFRQTVLLLAFFLTIAGCRLLLLRTCGTDLPQFDAWSMEGEETLRRYLTGTLSPLDLFSPGNEHRIPLSRLISLTLFLLNGLWDNQVQSIFSALFYSAFAVLILRGVIRLVTPRELTFLALPLLAPFVFPFGWENAIWGYQIQFYLLVSCSVTLLYFASVESHPSWPRTILFVLMQIITLFTMASGVLASMTLLPFWLARGARSGETPQRRRIFLVRALLSLLVILFWKFMVYNPVPQHESLRAHSAAEFFATLANLLSWPVINSHVWWVFGWLPWLILLVRHLRRPEPDFLLTRFALSLGGWVIMQAAATSYARNTKALISKYADPLSFTLIANGLAVILLARQQRTTASRTILVIFTLVWILGNGYALYGNLRGVVDWILPEKRAIFQIQIQKTRVFLSTGNLDFLIPRGKHQIPDRDFMVYARRITDPVINPILPRSVNYRYALTGIPSAPLSRLGDTLTEHSTTILSVGVLLGTAALFAPLFPQPRRRDRPKEQ